jgi:SAM-dependent methyltransferase
MKYKTQYLEIHERAYKRLRDNGKTSWSETDDLSERISFYQETLHKFDLRTGSRVLFLGCGDGETSLRFASAGYNVTGIDISPTAISWAREKALERKIKASFLETNITTDLLHLEQFDSIIDDHCLHCIVGHDRKIALDQVYSLLKNNGIFIVRTHCGDPPSEAPIDFLKMWDPISRCQVYDGIAGRYFGLPGDIVAEIENSRMTVLQNRVFHYPDGWRMLEVVAIKNS